MPTETVNTSVHSLCFNTELLNKPQSDAKAGDPTPPLKFRFRLLSNTHGSANATGTTTQNIQEAKVIPSTDAVEIRYFIDEHGVRTGFVIATATGYGYSSIPTTNIKIMGAAHRACELFVNDAHELISNPKLIPAIQNKLQEIAKEIFSGTITYKDKDITLDQRESSLSISIVTRTNNGNLNCLTINIGNNMVLIFDKDQKLKHCTPAREYFEHGAFAPMSVTRLIQTFNRYQYDVYQHEINDDDMIVHLNKGAWSQLPADSNILDDPMTRKQQICHYVDIGKFNLSFNPAKKERGAVSLINNIMKRMAHYITQTSQNMKRIAAKFQREIKVFFQRSFTDHSYLTQDWMTENHIPLADPDIIKLTATLNPEGNPSNTSAIDVINQLNGANQSVSSVCAPNRKLELIRAMIATPPDQLAALKYFILELTKLKITTAEVDDMIQRLYEETIINPTTRQLEPENNRVQLDYIRDNAAAHPLYVLGALGDIDLTIPGNDSRQKKFARQQVLLNALNQPNLSTTEKHRLFELFQDLRMFNKPKKNVKFDRYFRLHHSASWQDMVKTIRLSALSTLKAEVKACENEADKLKKIDEALAMPLFNKHRSNYCFTGAFGRTDAVKDLQQLRKKIHKQPDTIENTPLLR